MAVKETAAILAVTVKTEEGASKPESCGSFTASTTQVMAKVEDTHLAPLHPASLLGKQGHPQVIV